jgi:hypothetical protein
MQKPYHMCPDELRDGNCINNERSKSCTGVHFEDLRKEQTDILDIFHKVYTETANFGEQTLIVLKLEYVDGIKRKVVLDCSIGRMPIPFSKNNNISYEQ